MFKKARTTLYVHKVIDQAIHSRYAFKIRAGISMDADMNSDGKSKDEIVKMILNGDILKSDINAICNTYMEVREAMVMGNGGLARWVEK